MAKLCRARVHSCGCRGPGADRWIMRHCWPAYQAVPGLNGRSAAGKWRVTGLSLREQDDARSAQRSLKARACVTFVRCFGRDIHRPLRRVTFPARRPPRCRARDCIGAGARRTDITQARCATGTGAAKRCLAGNRPRIGCRLRNKPNRPLAHLSTYLRAIQFRANAGAANVVSSGQQ
jgi:hypothetical protein